VYAVSNRSANASEDSFRRFDSAMLICDPRFDSTSVEYRYSLVPIFHRSRMTRATFRSARKRRATLAAVNDRNNIETRSRADTVYLLGSGAHVELTWRASRPARMTVRVNDTDAHTCARTRARWIVRLIRWKLWRAFRARGSRARINSRVPFYMVIALARVVVLFRRGIEKAIMVVAWS